MAAINLLAIAFAAAMPNHVSAQQESNTSVAANLDVVELLGLEWGMSPDQVLDLGFYTLEIMEIEETGQPYNASVYPPILHDIGQVILYFGFDDRLWRIAILGKIYPDPGGTAEALIARYDEIREQLAEIYGPGESFHHNTTDTSKPDFVLGSLQIGRAWHFSEFITPDMHVQLGLRAGNVVSGHYALYLKNTILEQKVQTDVKANRRLGADLEDPKTEGGGSGNPDRE